MILLDWFREGKKARLPACKWRENLRLVVPIGVYSIVAALGLRGPGQAAASREPVQSQRLGRTVLRYVPPSEADPHVRHFNEDNVVISHFPQHHAKLLVFLPGTNGRPANLTSLLRVAAEQGFWVIGLEYDDFPAVVQVCPTNLRRDCSKEFREERVFGDGRLLVVRNTAEESIVARLSSLLNHLQREFPKEGWGNYLDNGRPRWPVIVIAGFSQGAGMAAYIAKCKAVSRAVLFSGPWDFIVSRDEEVVAAWMYWPGATAAGRWYGGYSGNESDAGRIVRAYAALGIPSDHVRRYLEDDIGAVGSPDYAHGNTIRSLRYQQEWKQLLGPATE